jgi:hypothetical protein
MTDADLQWARRVAIAELIHAAQQCNASPVSAVRAMAIEHVRRAYWLATEVLPPFYYTDADVQAFLRWWDETATQADTDAAPESPVQTASAVRHRVLH